MELEHLLANVFVKFDIQSEHTEHQMNLSIWGIKNKSVTLFYFLFNNCRLRMDWMNLTWIRSKRKCKYDTANQHCRFGCDGAVHANGLVLNTYGHVLHFPAKVVSIDGTDSGVIKKTKQQNKNSHFESCCQLGLQIPLFVRVSTCVNFLACALWHVDFVIST